LDVQVEYQVEECSSENRANNDCVHVQATKQILPRGGDIVFGVAHQHSGGIAASLHGEVAATLIRSLCVLLAPSQYHRLKNFTQSKY
jgi:hypothetical protein